MDRRRILTGLGGLALCGVAAPSVASTAIGDYEFLSVSDGNLVLPGAFFFDGLPADEVARVLATHGLSADQLEPPCNLSLLRHADRTVLFDAGSGHAFMPTAGTLLNSLAAAGEAPGDITHVVFTHGHPDHLWGILDDFDDPVFPNAEIMIGGVELDYWRDPNTVDTIGADRAAFAVGAARRLAAIEDQLTVFTDGQEILPGIQAQASFGHTPGHISFEVRAGGEALLIAGDAIGNHHMAFAHPEWPGGADQDQGLAAQTRARLLDQLAQDQTRVMGFHLPGGGMGRVERANGAFRFAGVDA